MDYWKGKIAVVTGASSGIGAQIALDLAEAGLEVIGIARRKDRVQDLAKEAEKKGGKIHPIACDVSQIESIVGAFEEIRKKFGKVHVLVNNAGIVKKGRFLDKTLSHRDLANVMDVNFCGNITCTREAFKLFECHDDNAYIIQINSISGHISACSTLSDTNVYPATKHALRAHTEALRLDLAMDGNKRVRVVSINPGVVKTEILEAGGYKPEEAHYARMPNLTSKDCSDAVIYLLSLPPHVNVTELTIKPVGETF